MFGGLLAQIEDLIGIEKKLPGKLRDTIGIMSFISLLGMVAVVDGYSSFLYKGGQGYRHFLQF